MFYGTRLNMKSVTAAEIAALAAWRILAQGDRVGGLVLSDSRLRRPSRPAAAAPPSCACSQLVAQANAALSAEAPVGARCRGPARRRRSPAPPGSSPTTGSSSSSPTSTAPATTTLRHLSGISRRNDVIMALVHDPSAHEIPETRPDRRRRRPACRSSSTSPTPASAATSRPVGGDRLRRLLDWQAKLDAAILPVSAGEPTVPQLLRLFGAPPRRRIA